ncbi:MAG: hypothetical protein MR296_01635 [Tenericutes bacterium]|nr:hypothetical protein [Mycoplasmatota bacterium]
MIKKYIYAKSDFSVILVRVEINEKIIEKILLEYENEILTNNGSNLIYMTKNILNCNDKLSLSYFISDLLNYSSDSEILKSVQNKILLCMHFKEEKRKIDLRKIMLNYEYKLDIYTTDPYYIDENTISKKVDQLPFIK